MLSCLRIAALLLLLAPLAVHAADPAGTEVTLTKRADNGPYGSAAYSFRLASQDYAVHRNYVDLVFNGCGLLHINPVNGMASRVVDLGVVPLTPATAAPPAVAAWRQDSITPQVNHAYLQEIRDDRQSFSVEYVVTAVTPGTVKLRWLPVDPNHKILPLAPGKGAAGTKGQCSSHSEE